MFKLLVHIFIKQDIFLKQFTLLKLGVVTNIYDALHKMRSESVAIFQMTRCWWQTARSCRGWWRSLVGFVGEAN